MGFLAHSETFGTRLLVSASALIAQPVSLGGQSNATMRLLVLKRLASRTMNRDSGHCFMLFALLGVASLQQAIKEE